MTKSYLTEYSRQNSENSNTTGDATPEEISHQESKEYKDILKSAGLPINSIVLHSCDCKWQCQKKKQHSGTVLCLEDSVVLYSKSFGGSTSIVVELQTLNPPQYEDSTMTLSCLTEDKSYSLVFKNIEKCMELHRTINQAREKLSKSKYRNILIDSRDAPSVPVLPSDEWYSLLATADTVTFQNGDTIIKQGSVVDKLYQIYDGSCDVCIKRTQYSGIDKYEVVETLVAGDKFGETYFVNPGCTATANVIVTSASLEVLVISRNDVMEIFNTKPETEIGVYSYVARQLSQRLTNRKLGGSAKTLTFLGRNDSQTKHIVDIKWQLQRDEDETISPQLVGVDIPGYHIEYGNFKVPQSDRVPKVDGLEHDYEIYQFEFVPRDHINLIGYSNFDKKFVAVSVCEKVYTTGAKVIMLVRQESSVSKK